MAISTLANPAWAVKPLWCLLGPGGLGPAIFLCGRIVDKSWNINSSFSGVVVLAVSCHESYLVRILNSYNTGLALITTKEALLWTDGRYFLQATNQLSDRWRLMRMGEDPPVEVWIADNLSDEAVIGIDSWCISVDSAQRYEQAFLKKNQMLFQLSSDLVDEVWKDRPPNDATPVIVHPVEFAGCSVAQKMKQLREKLQHEKASGIIITALDEVAWLYNVRGNDVHYSPVVHSYAIVTLHGAFFYVDKRKVTTEVKNYMSESGIDIREYDMVQLDVSLLASGQLKGSAVNGSLHMEKDINVAEHSKIWIDSNSCCLALYSKLRPDQALMLQSPIALPKAVKNPMELTGLRKAHIRDGAAVVQYLAWLDNQDLTSRVLSRLPLPPCMGTPARDPSDAVAPLHAPILQFLPFSQPKSLLTGLNGRGCYPPCPF
ncbi:Uncharacterized peptidase C22G7.01c [Triticum urartu]|uniref:Uncharacterized peptidase C22G7.01c n=1 Tax=Triticum urartu TaxID=4572 RepID=M7YK58_TRIUA|nr:Uncharacterized peptidase C22G7.01c [Triticum urartu]